MHLYSSQVCPHCIQQVSTQWYAFTYCMLYTVHIDSIHTIVVLDCAPPAVFITSFRNECARWGAKALPFYALSQHTFEESVKKLVSVHT